MLTRRLIQILAIVVTAVSLFSGSLAGASAHGEDRPIAHPSTQSDRPLAQPGNPQSGPGQPTTLDQIVQAPEFIDFVHVVAVHVNSTWADLFAASGLVYQDGAYVLFTQAGQTPCGAVTPNTDGSFYCPADQTIYLDAYMLAADASQYGRFVIDLTVAHLFGRFVLDQLGSPGLATEARILTADCLAGAWAAIAQATGAVTQGDLEDGLTYLIALAGGDELRAAAFAYGYVNDAPACFA